MERIQGAPGSFGNGAPISEAEKREAAADLRLRTTIAGPAVGGRSDRFRRLAYAMRA